MIVLHHLQQSRSIRIIWALEELGLAYELLQYQRLPSFAAPDQLKKIHPLGKAPILTDGEQTLVESACILDYLQGQYDLQQQFKPTDAAALQQYQYWMHYSEASLMPLLVMGLVTRSIAKHPRFSEQAAAQEFSAAIAAGYISPRLAEHLSYIADYFAEHEYAAGQFSFADIQLAFALQMLPEHSLAAYPTLVQYLKRLAARPAFQTAMQKNALLAE
ncbi:glutathione S-transferase family protein [Acinetobacter larvae]|uniref:Glutathione S-transferase n=1 Tax=Acinetobacter larvae TaxID=1789224 RepID=A0A1B2LWJ9_9GAMM|nr:glutathione S-transferase [Acinetobacter larvae]AOA57317.1 glutathione S-transferase [Acinetobacter larvae]